MTNNELFTKLTDAEYKVYNFIIMWREGKKTLTPDAEYVGIRVNKDKRSVQRAMAGLRAKGVIV